MPDHVRVAVIGTGALGKEHARIYAEFDREHRIEFTGVYDVQSEAARAVAAKWRVPVLPDFESAARSAEAFSLVTPTQTHHELAEALLRQGKHVLVEKPITDRAEQAARLIQLARASNAVLQVGHVERFNPVFKYLREAATAPQFIEAHRLSPYSGRSVDIGVVLDLMIHDLDVVLAFVQSPVQSVEAVGVSVLSPTEDIANARLSFANGCVANLTASRISPERLRKIRVFSRAPRASYISLDYRAQTGYVYRLAQETEEESSWLKKWLASKDTTVVSEFAGKRIVRQPVPLLKEEPLKLELSSFIDCVAARRRPVVGGEAGKQALDLALEITAKIATSPSAH